MLSQFKRGCQEHEIGWRDIMRNVRIVGVLVPIAWNAGGGTLQIGLQATDEQEYYLESDAFGPALSQCIRSRVTVCGELYLREGKNVLRVESFAPASIKDRID